MQHLLTVLVFCEPHWNDVYELHKYMAHMPDARYVHKEWVGPHINAKEPNSDGFSVESGASVSFHELFHCDVLTKPILSKVLQPDNVTRHKLMIKEFIDPIPAEI